MLKKTKKCMCAMLTLSMLITGVPMNAQASTNSQAPAIEVTFSSYNDLDLQYKLTDLTSAKNLQFNNNFGDMDTAVVPIVVDPSTTYQKWQGFGGSIEGATVYNYNQLSTQDKASMIKDLFNESTGNAYNMMRVCIGCSDFTIDAPEAGQYGNYPQTAGSGYWTYDDAVDEDTDGDGVADSDFDLSNFSIQNDISSGTIDFIKAAKAENPNVKFFASMWSAPAWMKKNNAIIWQNGQADPEIKENCYEVLAEYYCRFIESYQAQGIDIYAVTLQNEPDIKIGYPSVIFTPQNQIRFANCLKDAFNRHGLNTKIWGMDANEFETWTYAVPLLQSQAGNVVDGIAFHNYGGIEMLYPNSLLEEFSDKTFHITEMTIGANRLVEYMRNNISTYAYWIAYYDIDMANRTYGPGPSFWSKPQSDDADHWSLSQVSDDGNGGYQLNAKYYTFGQFSRYIEEGAVRIESTEKTGNVSNVAFQNPDGSTVLIVVNRAYDPHTNSDPNTPDQTICIKTPEGEFYDVIPGDTIATYKWNNTVGAYLDNANYQVSASSVHEGYTENQAIDNSAKSIWFSGKSQEAGDTVTLDLGASKNFSQISLYNGEGYLWDYPGDYNIWISNDGTDFSYVTSGKGGTGLSNIPLNQTVSARYIKIEITCGKDKWWNISNIAVFDKNQGASAVAAQTPSMITDKSQWSVQASSNRSYTESGQEYVYESRQDWFSLSQIFNFSDLSSAMFDGSMETRWTNQKAQEVGDSVNLDMVSPRNINFIEMECGTDYPRGYKILVSADGAEYREIKSGTGCEGKNLILLDTPVTAKCIRIELTENCDNSWWSIYELQAGTKKADYERLAIDDDLNTNWCSAETQTVSDEYTTAYLLNMGAEQNICGVSINSGSEMWAYLEEYEVYAWKDGEEAKLVAKGCGNKAITQIYFEEVDAKYIWIKAAKNSTDGRKFAIAELNVYKK